MRGRTWCRPVIMSLLANSTQMCSEWSSCSFEASVYSTWGVNHGQATHPSASILCRHGEVRFAVTSSFRAHWELRGEGKRARERRRGHPSSRHESGRWPRKVTYSPRYHCTWGPCYGLNGMRLASVEIHHEIWFPNGKLLRFGGASPFWGI